MAPDLTFRDVTETTWQDFERHINERGGPSYCWCCAWRDVRGSGAPSEKNARHDEMEQRVCAGEPIGILAYLEGEPVAWCSIAPRDTYRPLGGPADEPGTSVWSVVCFFTKRPLRKQGVARQLLDAAIEHASGQARMSSRRTQSTRTRRATASWASARCTSHVASRRSAGPAAAVT